MTRPRRRRAIGLGLVLIFLATASVLVAVLVFGSSDGSRRHHRAPRVESVRADLEDGEFDRAALHLVSWLDTEPSFADPAPRFSTELVDGWRYELAGRVRFAQSRSTPAVAFFGRSIAIAQQRGDCTLEAAARIGRARVRYHLRGAIEPAQDDLVRALACARAARAVGLEAAALRHQGVVTWWFAGRASEALEHHFLPALALFRGVDDRRGAAITLGSIGLAYQSVGDPARALASFREALAEQRAIDDRAGTTDTLRHLAGLYRDTGDGVLSRRMLDEAREIAHATGYRLAAHGIEVDRAVHELADRDVDEALAALAWVLAREGDAPLLASYRLRSMSDLARAAGDPVRAERLLAQALAIEPENSRVETRDVVSQLLSDAEIARDLGEWARADTLLIRAREHLADGTEWRRWHWGTLLIAAEVAAHRGRLAEAVDVLTQAADEEAEWLAEAPSQQGPTVPPARYDRLYGLLLTPTSPLRRHVTLAARADMLAFRFAEHARLRAFRAVTQAAFGPATKTQSNTPSTAMRSLLEALEHDVERLHDRPEDASWSALRRRYDAYQQAVVDATLIPTADRGLTNAPPSGSRPPTPTAIRAQLDPSTAVISYVFAGEQPFAMVLDSSSVASVALPIDRAALRAKVRLFEGLLDPSASLDADAWQPVASDLWMILIAPLQSRGLLDDVDRLAILPADVLNRLPFAALIDREGPDRRFWVEEHALFFPPSASALIAPRVASPSRTGSLAVGLGASIGGLPPLRFAHAEARIAAVAAGGEVLLDVAATERAIKARAGSLRQLHIASHAQPMPALPLLSAIKLAPGHGDDGNLTIGEILELDLATELVVLASCRGAASSTMGSGRSRSDRPDERRRFSLVDAFLRAGSDAVIASLMPVDDAAALAFMRSFYSDHPRADPVSALAASQRRMLAGPHAFRHPGYWAPFVLVGR